MKFRITIYTGKERVMFVYIIDNDCLKLTEFQKVLYYLGTKESTDEPVMPYSFKITV